jgi:hypothetical protein
MQFALHLIAAGCLSMSMQGNILLLKQPGQRYCFHDNYTFVNDWPKKPEFHHSEGFNQKSKSIKLQQYTCI